MQRRSRPLGTALNTTAEGLALELLPDATAMRPVGLGAVSGQPTAAGDALAPPVIA
jgi:hypothetical protein